ncbi:MAG: hypothetical protein Q7K40_03845 [bacterium]|nr:hypothetical protein [bacterium]
MTDEQYQAHIDKETDKLEKTLLPIIKEYFITCQVRLTTEEIEDEARDLAITLYERLNLYRPPTLDE